MDLILKLYDAAGLGAELRKTQNAIYVLMSRIRRGQAPADALPQPLSLPGRRYLWDQRDVQRWLDAHRTPRVGRPPKVEVIAKRQASGGEVQS